MAPATPNRPATATHSHQATPAKNVILAKEFPEIPIDTNKEGEVQEEIPKTRPTSRKDK
ncbi:hypothetical protein ACHAPU_011490, partial [Fusarium lateritium]